MRCYLDDPDAGPALHAAAAKLCRTADDKEFTVSVVCSKNRNCCNRIRDKQKLTNFQKTDGVDAGK